MRSLRCRAPGLERVNEHQEAACGVEVGLWELRSVSRLAGPDMVLPSGGLYSLLLLSSLPLQWRQGAGWASRVSYPLQMGS